MNRTLLTTTLLTVAMLPALAAGALEETRTLRHSLRFPDAGRPGVLDVDNIQGSIKVTSWDGDTVEAVIEERRTADGREELELSKREVTLDLEPDPLHNTVRLFVDGPFRCDDRDDCGKRGRRSRRRDPGYEVAYRFELKVPVRTDLILSTVNGGDIEVRGMKPARFAIHNVNGAIALDDLTGAGEAETVNGPVTVRFATNPDGACRFSSVNGDLDLGFRRGLGADFLFETMNGEALSDFPFAALPREPGKRRREDGKLEIESGAAPIRIGAGGPRIHCETLNGDILVRNRDGGG